MDEAIAEYQHNSCLAPADTRDAEAHYNLGVMLEQKGQPTEAVQQYEQALAIDPGFAKVISSAVRRIPASLNTRTRRFFSAASMAVVRL